MSEEIIYHLANGHKETEALNIPLIIDDLVQGDFRPVLISKKHAVGADLAKIGTAIFLLEKQLKKKWAVKKIQIPISPITCKQINSKKVASTLNEIILFLLHENVEVILESKSRKYKKVEKFPAKEKTNICLFSGGVDSYSGILNSKAKLKDVAGVFAYHSDQGRLRPIIGELSKQILKTKEIPLFTMKAPPHEGGIAQTRGFLYLITGGVFGELLNAKTIIVSECGPTMYQPLFSPLDNVTLTTHPYLLVLTKRFLKSFTGKVYKIITPNEDLTKAEVISASPMPEFLKRTHSCITTSYGRNLGECYGCILRKLAFMVAGIQDRIYPADVLTKDVNDTLHPYRPRGNVGDYTETVEALMKLSYYVLFDYKSMPFYSKRKIREFKKHDLFKRFAMDNFSGLYLLFDKNGGGRNRRVRKLYRQMRDRLTKEQLEKRIEEVRSDKFKPDFRKII
jgi:hypothetical protein